ncbi:hypothetical protein Cfla_1138 [Cellulomonas flavigena DSM 20109]|uniref:DUF4188 domain-containing protein n=1 Tax=Cellulomonas flavigena (strain ATCC 482 / DSM 20109 / BCRC 11376 / JCM 18109 / NBRC 3775 / NCIMB 8073 / NRS 134) TaxID=446466 RepID=D5ULK0_CELFN|nr:hypothetical protein [Cellulomonas flavigena]ADG74042.1 hypothetical protein Cfla_1138 [Cellulomonas flavigena DSM 20109]
MRTRDFSRAPAPGRAEALVVVERPGGAVTWVRATRRAARTADGHLWSTGVRARDASGAVRGRVVCFATSAQAARWTTTLDPARDRWRVFRAEAEGYSNGVWRAEGDVMAHVERFTPTSVESAQGRTPPLVAPAPPRRRAEGRPRAGDRTGRPGTPSAAGAMFLGATRYRGPHAWAVLSREWSPMVADMRRMRGYVWHRVYWAPPFTLGTLAFFADRDALLAFARHPAHRRLMTWITRDRRHGTGGYIRVHVAEPAPAPGAAGGGA